MTQAVTEQAVTASQHKPWELSRTPHCPTWCEGHQSPHPLEEPRQYAEHSCQTAELQLGVLTWKRKEMDAWCNRNEPRPVLSPDVLMDLPDDPDHIDVYLGRWPEENEPLITLVSCGRDEILLTLADARTLAEALLQAAELAKA